MANCIAESKIPLESGDFKIQIFELDNPKREITVLSILKDQSSPPLVRIHSECFTGEVLSSLKCDCKFQLAFALKKIAECQNGVVIYLKQEGRGIGLANKIRAYALQESGLNTIEANQALGLPVDARDFSDALKVMTALNIKRLRLNTNNPQKIKTLKEAGFDITEIVPSLSPVNKHNRNYLVTKFQSMGHELKSLFEEPDRSNLYKDDKAR